MANIITGSKRMSLAKPDAGGNMGYFLEFEYAYSQDDPEKSMTYSNIKFSGPGKWEEYSEGDDYPYSQMFEEVFRSTDSK